MKFIIIFLNDCSLIIVFFFKICTAYPCFSKGFSPPILFFFSKSHVFYHFCVGIYMKSKKKYKSSPARTCLKRSLTILFSWIFTLYGPNFEEP